MLELPAAKVEITSESVTIHIPFERHAEWWALAHQATVEKSQQLYVKLGKPRKPRTTGYRSQNTRIHGHATQIADHVGEAKRRIIGDAVDLAMSMYPEFRTREDYKGRIVPIDEPDWDTREANAVCAALENLATFAGCILKEYKFKKDGTLNPNYQESEDA